MHATMASTWKVLWWESVRHQGGQEKHQFANVRVKLMLQLLQSQQFTWPGKLVSWRLYRQCAALLCEPLPPLEHGSIELSNGNRVNSVATYSCDRGYTFKRAIGNTRRTCNEDRSWSGSAPICIRKSSSTVFSLTSFTLLSRSTISWPLLSSIQLSTVVLYLLLMMALSASPPHELTPQLLTHVTMVSYSLE